MNPHSAISEKGVLNEQLILMKTDLELKSKALDDSIAKVYC